MSLLPLPVVRAHELPPQVREVLRPGETMQDRVGVAHTLPSTFMMPSAMPSTSLRITTRFRLTM